MNFQKKKILNKKENNEEKGIKSIKITIKGIIQKILSKKNVLIEQLILVNTKI